MIVVVVLVLLLFGGRGGVLFVSSFVVLGFLCFCYACIGETWGRDETASAFRR